MIELEFSRTSSSGIGDANSPLEQRLQARPSVLEALELAIHLVARWKLAHVSTISVAARSVFDAGTNARDAFSDRFQTFVRAQLGAKARQRVRR